MGCATGPRRRRPNPLDAYASYLRERWGKESNEERRCIKNFTTEATLAPAVLSIATSFRRNIPPTTANSLSRAETRQRWIRRHLVPRPDYHVVHLEQAVLAPISVEGENEE